MLWGFPCVTVLWKLSLPKDRSLLRLEVGCILVAKVSVTIVTIAGLLKPFLRSCIDVCLEKKKGEVLGWNRCWVSAYLVGVTRRKRGDHGAVSCWWAVVAGCYFLVAPVRKSIKDQLTGKVKSDMWVARAGTWQPGSLHGSRMGYLPCLTSCRLLGLYPRARGEHLTSQLLWVAA